MTASKLAAAAAGIITAVLLQATLVGPLTFPVPVSLPVVLVILVAVYAGPGTGVALGFIAGLVTDLGSDNPAGVHALCWLGAGLAGGLLGGLPARRGYRGREVAALAAVLAALTSVALTGSLALLGSHGASAWLAIRDEIPTGFGDALLALALVTPLRALLRALRVRAPRSGLHPVEYAEVG